MTDRRAEIERALIAIWSEVLSRPDVGRDDGFFALGGDSISSLLVVFQARAGGFELSPADLLEHDTLAALAAHIASLDPPRPQDGTPVAGRVALAPIQHWFFEQGLTEWRRWSLATIVEARQRVDAGRLRRALAALVERHEMLRARYVRDGGAWEQHVAAEAPAPVLHVVDLAGLSDDQAEARQRQELDLAAGQIDPSAGAVVAGVLLHRSLPARDRLLLLAHHLVADGVSVRIMLEDLESLYRAESEGRQAPPRSARGSYARWVDALTDHAGSAEVREQRRHWAGATDAAAAQAPVTSVRGADDAGSAGTVSAELHGAVVQRLLEDVPRGLGLQVHHVLLAGLMTAWREWTGSGRLQVDVEGHGRETLGGVDPSGTVGWFTCLYPLVLDVEPAASVREAAELVRSQLEAVPGRGLGHGLLRYLAPDGGAELAGQPRSPVSFNYLGRFERSDRSGGVFGAPLETPVLVRDPGCRRPHLIDVVAAVTDGTLRIDWVFSRARHGEPEIAALVQAHARHVEGLVREAGAAPRGRRDLAIEPQELRAVLRQVGRRRGDHAG